MTSIVYTAVLLMTSIVPDLKTFPAQGEAFAEDAEEFGLTTAQIVELRNLAYRHREWVKDHCPPGQCPEDWAQDAKWCFECWDALHDIRRRLDSLAVPNTEAVSGWHSWEVEWALIKQRLNRERIQDLYKLLGPEMYRARVMPPPTPAWHFGYPVPDYFTPPSQRNP